LPILRYAPGELLLVDRHPANIRPGDAVLYQAPTGELGLGIVAHVSLEVGAAGQLRIAFDNPDCPATPPGENGALSHDSVRARVVLALP